MQKKKHLIDSCVILHKTPQSAYCILKMQCYFEWLIWHKINFVRGRLLESPSRCGWTQIDLSAFHRQAFPADAAWTVWTHQLRQSDVNFHLNRAQPMTVSLQWGESALLFKCSICSSRHSHSCTPEMLSGSKQNLGKSRINFKENWSNLETN